MSQIFGYVEKRLDEKAKVEVGISPSQKKMCYLLDWKPFKNDEKSFFFRLKSYFCSQDISVFVMTFWSCRKNDLIRKTRLTSKFMTWQLGLQTIAVHVLSNISQSKGKQTMKFGQIIEHKRIMFLQKLCRKRGRETSSRPLCFLKKLMRWKQVVCSLVSAYFHSPQLAIQ